MGRPAIRFSLIVATVDRSHQLTRLLESLKAQTYQNFEVIVVDQNPPGFLAAVIAPFHSCLSILHLHSKLGLSLARNVGLGHVSGQVVGFPDDDCWYPPDALERIADLLTRHPEWGGLTGRPADPENPDGFRWYHQTSGALDLMNLWRRSISITIFLRRNVVQAVGAFDKDLGLGTPTGMFASEESEFLIRALKHGFNLHYCAGICVYHAALPPHDESRIARASGEGRAFGYVLRKHKYPLAFVMHTWIRASGGATHASFHGNWNGTMYYWDLLRGRLRGWFVDALRCTAAGTTAAGKIRLPQQNVTVAESPKSAQSGKCSAARAGDA
jgi:glycosyltransferase involved in cell wall biosynthesis